MNAWLPSPHEPVPGDSLCLLEDIPDGGVLELRFGPQDDGFSMVVIRSGCEVRAYQNLCPHHSLPLNYVPGRFLTYSDGTIVCAHHLATFRVDDGYCVDGPCAGASLRPFPLTTSDGRVRMAGNEKENGRMENLGGEARCQS